MPEIGRYAFGRVTIDGHEETRDVMRYAQLDPRTTAAALHLTC